MHLNDKKISEELFEDIEPSHKDSADIVYGVCNFIDSYMKKNGLRDFADQLIDGIRLIRKHPDVKPLFSHILIDEFQDVNSLQMNLVSLLNSQNVFCVGDPRQSIYGWRGSDISFIKDFPKDHDNCEVISLVKNYRSSKAVVELFNESIRYMNLPDLETVNEGKKDIRLLNFKNEEAEAEFVVQAILNSDVPHDNIFILARTNKQLVKISGYLHNNKVPHEMRSDEFGKITKDEGALEESKKVVLATIHAIKGLEAELVFVVGCTRNKFPCKGSEHPVIEMIKIDEYDKYNEERRLFYVALSRAKSSLYLTYVGKSHTDFITSAMTKIVYGRTISNGQGTLDTDTSMFDRLKRWRLKTAKEYGMPAFMVLTDKTLTGLIAQQPFSIEDLSKVPGFGPTKINQFGEDILKVLHS